MKKFNFLVASLLISGVWLLLSNVPTHAEDASLTPSGISQEVKKERLDLRSAQAVSIQEIKDERAGTKSAIQAIHGKFNLVRAEIRAAILTRKFAFIAQRFDNIIARFDARIKILQDAGKGSQLTLTISKLDDAKAKLVTAKAAGVAAVNGFKAVTSTSTKEDFIALQALVKTANEAFKSVTIALKDALKELKTVSKPALPAASSAVNNSL